MNTKTQDLAKAFTLAQELADNSRLIHAVYKPLDPIAYPLGGEPYFIDPIPLWWQGREGEWAASKEARGAHIIRPKAKPALA